MKVDFSKIKIATIEGGEEEMDVRKRLGNTLYYQSSDLAGSMLGQKIYTSDGEIELTEEECNIAFIGARMTWKEYIMLSAISKVFGKSL